MAYKYGYCDGFSDAVCGAAEDTSSAVNGKLGCSLHVAYIQNKCNGVRLCELLNASNINYTRILDDISTASVTIPITGEGANDQCCTCLADAEPWCHQLTIVREGDGVVWTGPIQKITYGQDQVVVEAKDKMVWLQYRVNEIQIDHHANGPPNPGPYIPMTEIAYQIMIEAMAEDLSDNSPCFLEDAQGNNLIIIPPGVNGNLSDGFPPDFHREFVFDPFAGPTAYDDVTQLVQAGIEFTVINNSVILTSSAIPDVALGTLTDDMILGEFKVIKDGSTMGNRFYIRWEASDGPPPHGDDTDPIACRNNCNLENAPTICPKCVYPVTPPCYIVPCPGVDEISDTDIGCYGRIERVVDKLGCTDAFTAQGIAGRYLERGKTARRLVELPSGTRLSPDCPWEINDMIPGQRIDVAFSTLCLPIFQSFKLQGMEVSDNGSEEVITVDLIAIEQI